MPFEAATQMERDLAEDFRTQGYTVMGDVRSIPSRPMNFPLAR